MLAGGQVDGRYLGIQDQNGTTHFLQRFALRAPGKCDPAAAMRFAMEHQNPLVCGPVISTAESPNAGLDPGVASFPPDRYGLLKVTDPNVLLWAVKPAEEGIGHGVIARLWNVSDTAANSAIAFTPGLADVTAATHVETDMAPVTFANGAFSAAFAPQQLRTFRLAARRPTTVPAQ